MSSQQSSDFRITIRFLVPKSWAEGMILLALCVLAILFLPLAAGLCLGYIMGYYLFWYKRKKEPRLWPLTMNIGVFILLGAILSSYAGWMIWQHLPETKHSVPIAIHLFSQTLTILGFLLWRSYAGRRMAEGIRYGSARYITRGELKPYRKQKKGLYIGGGKLRYPSSGHLVSIAGTRGGKMVNLLAANLLGGDAFKGSKVVFDPKGELTAITASYQRSLGKTVQILNPWNVLGLGGGTYNPMDLVTNQNSLEQVPDDCQLLAEMIVPSSAGKTDHWDDKARAMIAGILLFITTLPVERRTLIELWRLLRLPREELLETLKAMALCDADVVGPIIEAAAYEIMALMENSEKEFSGVLSTAQKHSDVFKSIPLQRSLATSSFDIGSLADGNTILYVIIPADKLKSHYRWLRLVITTALKTVVRQPNKSVAFMIDETASLGYLPELQTGMAMYAGYGIYLWTIWQSLAQIKDLYKDSWENFIANAAVRHFFAVNENTTADYVSKLAGVTTTFGGKDSSTSSRPLLSPDEVRRSDNILTFIDNKPVAALKKVPYYKHRKWRKRAAPNPYYLGK